MPRLDSNALLGILFDDLHLPAGVALAVAYSGGRDSQVLLHALSAARRERGFALTALHFDHGLSPLSAHWTARCAAVCREWGIAFASNRQVVARAAGQSLEAQARQSRYAWFKRVVEPGQVLLTAHHADDHAETVMLNLLRGGGLESLAGIPRQRMLSAAKGTRVARPLLAYPGEALAEYARRHGLRWIDDPANRSPAFDRNYLHASVIPLLRARWPGVVASMANSAEHCREAAACLDRMAAQRFEECRADAKQGVFCLAPPLDVRLLKPLERAPVIHLLRHWIHRHGRRSPSSGQLATLFEQVFQAQSGSPGVRWNGGEVRYFNGHLYLTASLGDGPAPGATLNWDLRERALGVNGLRVEVKSGISGGLDPRRLRGGKVQLVWRRGGERMTLPGRTHRSRLKKLFQQNAVPPWERRALPLLTVDGEVAWAHGVGPSAACCCGKNEPGLGLRFVAGGEGSIGQPAAPRR